MLKFQPLNRYKKGFTLAELLIVVAIIGVLLAILIPTFTSALQNAQLTADAANARANYSEHLMTYMDDHSKEITRDDIVGANGTDFDIKNSTVEHYNGIITIKHKKSGEEKTFKVDVKAIEGNWLWPNPKDEY